MPGRDESLLMKARPGAIDCDIHPAVPNTKVLLPYLPEYWRDQLVNRFIDRSPFVLQSYPPNSPIACRPDWRPAQGLPGTDFDALRKQALDAFGTKLAICNVLHGSIALFNEDMAAVLCSAVNDWIAKELLDRDPRLRASILLPIQSPDHCVKEIERLAPDKRFVSVLTLVMGETLLGNRRYWPIYAAAERHGFTVGIHAGSSYHHPLTGSGWPTYYLEDYAAQSLGFHTQLGSLICEGVFVKYPKLKVVLIESGITWLPPYLWRLSKFWRGVRNEVPWIDRSPEEYVRDHIRLTIQPFDAPPSAAHIGRIMDQLQSDDMLLFSTDFPHWQFDGADMLPAGISPALKKKILIDNPLATYPRLGRPS